MTCMSLIRKLVSSLKPGEIFTTRECMVYGGRSAVDNSLYKLVKSGVIERLARGVFVSVAKRKASYTSEEIAAVKARSFGRKTFDHGSSLASMRQLPVDELKNYFALTRSSTSFFTTNGRIRMRIASGRKEHLAHTTPGDIIRALWHLGNGVCTLNLVKQVVTLWNKNEVSAILREASWMPYWLLSLFRQVTGPSWLRVATEVISERSRAARGNEPPHQL